MSLFSKLNARFGRFAVPNLTLILIGGQVFLYLASRINPAQAGGDVLDNVRLFPAEVLQGEVWRLVTFVFDPPTPNLLFAFFFWYLFYLFGTTLEQSWGTFRYNVFLAIGYMATVAMSLIVCWVDGVNDPANNGFLYGTVFLAFAKLYPDFVLSIFFVLPVKVKWLAFFQWCIYGLTFLSALSAGEWMTCGMVVASVLNYLLFFGRDIWRDLKQGHRRMRHQARTVRAPQRLIHTCAVCGLNSEDAPQAQFRYCSQCGGERCYCPEHLHNHEHITPRETAAVHEPAR
jgi:hypothetical protein